MAKSKSDKPLALLTIFGSLTVIIIWYLLLGHYSHQVGGNFKNPIYLAGVIVFGLLYAVTSVVAYLQADDPAYDNTSRKIVIILAVFILAWSGGWVAGSNEKVEPGSPQMEDATQVKQVTIEEGRHTGDEYIEYIDSLRALPSMYVISDFYNVIAVDTITTPHWQRVVDSLLCKNNL